MHKQLAGDWTRPACKRETTQMLSYPGVLGNMCAIQSAMHSTGTAYISDVRPCRTCSNIKVACMFLPDDKPLFMSYNR